jgi:hypothetical protein
MPFIDVFALYKIDPTQQAQPEIFVSPHQTTSNRCKFKGQTDYNCCSSRNPCGKGLGDCDFDRDCLRGLKCGTNNCWRQFPVQNGYNWDIQADCCYGE